LSRTSTTWIATRLLLALHLLLESRLYYYIILKIIIVTDGLRRTSVAWVVLLLLESYFCRLSRTSAAWVVLLPLESYFCRLSRTSVAWVVLLSLGLQLDYCCLNRTSITRVASLLLYYSQNNNNSYGWCRRTSTTCAATQLVEPYFYRLDSTSITRDAARLLYYYCFENNNSYAGLRRSNHLRCNSTTCDATLLLVMQLYYLWCNSTTCDAPYFPDHIAWLLDRRLDYYIIILRITIVTDGVASLFYRWVALLSLSRTSTVESRFHHSSRTSTTVLSLICCWVVLLLLNCTSITWVANQLLELHPFLELHL
jgi:hypothetical protein